MDTINNPNDHDLEEDRDLIFERDVEDPGMASTLTLTRASTLDNMYAPVPEQALRFTSPSSPLSLSRRQSSNSLYSQNGLRQCVTHTGAPRLNENPLTEPQNTIHHTLENMIPPALDASCSIVTDDNTDLNQVDMIYSPRPSTLGLSSALGNYNSTSTSSSPVLFRSYSHTTSFPTAGTKNSSLSTSKSPPLALTRSYSNNYQLPASTENNISSNNNNRVLRFYSYFDMLSDELNSHPISRAPSALQQPDATITAFNNPFDPMQARTGTSLEKNKNKASEKKSPKQSVAGFHISLGESDAYTTDEEESEEPTDTDANANAQNRNVVTFLQHPRPSVAVKNSLGSHLSRSRSNSSNYAFTANRNPLMINSNTSPTGSVSQSKNNSSLLTQPHSPPMRGRAYSHTTGIPSSNASVPAKSLSLRKTNTFSTSNQLRRSRTPGHYMSINDDAFAPLQTECIGSVLRKKISRTADSLDSLTS
ncbi:hypothetical protein TPHA_0F01430 [Tetrapisispora phaffii CBS 4417]|uniref:Uncharacterized protein n=1 Tax=Tetrapisispora phaffii (strain ATCC 24235 / CBS 4417 / NBRC 1672 / NRRL Y-8282 / UCD 70-5) TaxID=1071381 RepID=G8BV45_TETPH|nr:hypothetical protein TPHA_0F01430 [Tetrapisispora phaffii CBS 4417]CCE63627.1 hypothetical protein TPHA_0F01430 [Tetrapisispora phaffii CBS 4417]